MDLQLIYESIHLMISTFSRRTLVFSRFFVVMVLFSTILVNMTTTCLWKLLLSFLIEDYDVNFEVNCFSNNLVMSSNWSNYVSMANVVTFFTTTWCYHWSMDSQNLHSCFLSLEMPFANLLVFKGGGGGAKSNG
jgi:hypothetical protein